jgi:hypothetical protein
VWYSNWKGKKQMTKGQRFLKLANEAILRLGGKKFSDSCGFPEYEFETPLGRMTALPHINQGRQPYCTIFCQFDEPARAYPIVYCNSCSGKWNFHFGQHTSETDAVGMFEKQIRALVLAPDFLDRGLAPKKIS